MRILQISSARHFGGGERHLVDLCRGLHERGHDVLVALRPTNEWQDRLSFLPPENFLHVSIRNSFGMFSAKRIARFISDREIDLVHAHVARDYLAASVAVRAAKRAKLIITRHVLFPLKPFHRFALSNIDAAVAVSPAVAAGLEGIFPHQKIRYIANGIKVDMTGSRSEIGDEFRTAHSIPADTVLIGTVGELKELKGQRDLILAAAEIVKRLPEARFLVVGVDNSQGQRFRRELRRLTRALGIEEGFIWLDWLDDLRPVFAAMDLFVSPSHSESFGLAILEAMASRKPVIATETEGARSLIDDADLLVPVGAPVELAASIVTLIGDKRRMDVVAEKLSRTAAEMFSIERFIDEHERLYLELRAR